MTHVQYTGTQLSMDDVRYIAAIQRALAANITLRTTDVCPECGERPQDNDYPHHMMDGFVVIGCEGYHVIDPNTVGIDSPHWQDHAA